MRAGEGATRCRYGRAGWAGANVSVAAGDVGACRLRLLDLVIGVAGDFGRRDKGVDQGATGSERVGGFDGEELRRRVLVAGG